MKLSQRRAWAALEIGPLWRPRQPAEADDRQLASDTGPADEIEPIAAVGPPEAIGPSEAISSSEAIGSPAAAADGLDLAGLRAAVAACHACRLCEQRTNTVFGVGDEQAGWMVIGEAPGADEDRLGEPFVGRAGQLLDAMLAAVGRSRQRGAYIANVLKCRPPGNRNPQPEEVARCMPYLRRQIALIRPKVILVVGKVAAHALLDTEASLASLRGRLHRYALDDTSIPVVVTYHPAYLLRQPLDKAKAWEDLQKAARLSGPDG